MKIKTVMNKNESLIPIERIEQKIYVIRGERVMLDSDLAEIYSVETRVFNQAVKRNLHRFPEDFMFQLTAEEDEHLRFQIGASKDKSLTSQIVTSKKGRGGRRYLPYVFTEHGAIMAANILSSERAVEASVQVVRAFVKLRQLLSSNAELAKKFEALEKKYDAQFKVVFDAIKKLMLPPDKPKGNIGFTGKTKK
jgi:hypothetical protein